MDNLLADVQTIVSNVVNGKWAIPELQREFVWPGPLILRLGDSLYQRYPIGELLLWHPEDDDVTALYGNGPSPDLWVLDGQQRSTSMAILCGTTPPWLVESPERYGVDQTRVLFDLRAGSAKSFVFEHQVRRKSDRRFFVPTSVILSGEAAKLEPRERRVFVREHLATIEGLPSDHLQEAEDRLDELGNILGRQVPATVFRGSSRRAAVVFVRRNRSGKSATAAEARLATLSISSPSWRRDRFEAFRQGLRADGFEIDLTTLLRSFMAIHRGSGVFSAKDEEQIPQTDEDLADAWRSTERSWRAVRGYLVDRGIESTSLLSSPLPLITLVALNHRFPAPFSTDLPLRWLVGSLLVGRYVQGSGGKVESEIQTITKPDIDSGEQALSMLAATINTDLQAALRCQRFTEVLPARTMKSYRLLLQTLLLPRRPHDWLQHTPLRSPGRPGGASQEFDWHHVYAAGFLRRDGRNKESNCVANHVILLAETNKIFGDNAPNNYLATHAVAPARLLEQLIEAPADRLTLDHFDAFIEERARAIRTEALRFFDLPDDPASEAHGAA